MCLLQLIGSRIFQLELLKSSRQLRLDRALLATLHLGAELGAGDGSLDR